MISQHVIQSFLRAILIAICAITIANTAAAQSRPNVVLIMTDDQGWGDLGMNGNDKIRTPRLDGLARQSVVFDRFYVSPVCAPTRACLMTGRYNYRTGVVDTYIGRAMMHSDEVTIAEMLSAAGYRTGIFGKWHLGDNYPLRPNDQGFEDSLVHKGGGIGQPSDPPGGDHYFNPTLYRNGAAEKTEGYCSDIYTTAAIRFIEQSEDRPFFVYLPFNCPHSPFEIADRYVQPYLETGLDEQTAKIYGMVENIDENVGRLLDALEAKDIAENTIVVFLTDNGPNGQRYNGNMRGVKGSVYEGGIRTACFVRWPTELDAGHRVDQIAAHIDWTPTLLAACGAEPPANVRFDGRNLLPLLRGDRVDWPERTLYLQWHRGDQPQPLRAFAAVGQQYKLVQPRGVQPDANPGDQDLQLYDLQADASESRDLSKEMPDRVASMKEDHLAWFRDVSATRGYDPPRIQLGTPHEDPVVLTRQDWRGPRAGWGDNSLGHWEVKNDEPGTYHITVRFAPDESMRTAYFRLGDVEAKGHVNDGERTHAFHVSLPSGSQRLEAWLDNGDTTTGVQYVEVAREQ
ncbi:MAG: arylsulfatase [Pirellulales bacterium]